jgi:NADH dehydrogenase FAD-containing subunit
VTSGGYLDVLSTLQLKTNPRVFAAGDVVALPEQHTIIKAASHGPVIAANILALIQANGKPRKALKQYTKAMDGILITNGRVSSSLLWWSSFELTRLQTRGSTYLDFFTIFGKPIMMGDWFSAKMKSQGLMVGMAKGMVNQD